MYLHPPRGGACSNLFKDVLKMNKAPAILLESGGMNDRKGNESSNPKCSFKKRVSNQIK